MERFKDRLKRAFIREPRVSEVRHDEYGRSTNSGIPMAPPVGYVQQPSMIEIVRQQIRSEHLRLQALQAGMETFEEADDFDVEDDFDPSTPYEETFDPVEYEVRNKLRQDEFAASVEARLSERRAKEEIDNGNSSGNDKGRKGSSGVRVGSEDRGSDPGEGEDEKPPVSGGIRDGVSDNPRNVGKVKSG